MQLFSLRRAARSTVCSGLFAAGLLFAQPASAATVSSADARDLVEVGRSLPRGSAMRIDGVALDGRDGLVGFDLVRFEATSEGATFVVQTDAGPKIAKPDLPVYFRGAVDGLRGSVAVLSMRASGEIRGVVSASGSTWLLSRDAASGNRLRSGRVEAEAFAKARKFECEVKGNPNPARPVAAPTAERNLRLPISYTARVAVELDYDYFTTFSPDADAAFLYALDLMAFTSALGESELGMNVQVPFMQLWTTSADPYSSGNARLGQVRERWNASPSTNCGGLDCTTINRSTVILLSSAPTGGVAYLPGLCDSWHSPTGGAAYAYAGSIEGDFTIDSPNVVWDVVVTTHELGHNFGSQHTHCYDPPVDGCYASEEGCYAGAEGLPSGCPGSDQNCGTIMSYCHLLSGGMDNVALTYGAGHGYGNDPDRVPAAMIAQIVSEAAAAPGCLVAEAGMTELEVSKLGTGSGTVTSSPTGINCGGACRTYFDGDTVVTLTATPNAFSDFAGWSGDPDCSDGVVTLSAATGCVATFNGNCGAGNEDCDDGDECTADSCPADDHCENAGTPRDPMTCLAADGARLQITNSTDPAADKMSWQWSKGEAFAQVDLGDPSLDTRYTFCVYDTTGGVGSLATSLSIPGASAGWKSKGSKGWNYSDSSASQDGIKKLQLKPGAAGKTKVKMSGLGASLPLPSPFSGSEMFNEDPSVTVQLLNTDGECWTSAFDVGGTSANSPTTFKASGQ